jgi:hypothetical protein
MNRSRIAGVMLLGFIIALSTGCGKSKALQDLEQFEKDVCACNSLPCVEALAKKDVAAMGNERLRPSESAAKEMTEAAAKACVEKLKGAATKK